MSPALRDAWTIGLLALVTAPLRSQGTGKQYSDPVIRVTVDLVQVDAVVTDSQGRHITGLKPEDFRIFEDGKPQKITHFSYVSGTAIAGSPAPLNPEPRQPSGRTPTAIPVPVKALRPEEVQRTIVLMADDLGLSSDDIPNVRKAMKNFVDRQMQDGDLASILTTSGGMGAMQQLTSDKRQLLASIERIHYVPGRTGLTWYAPILPAGPDKKFRLEIEQRLGAARLPVLTVGTLNGLAYAIQGLREMPGRKAIALFSDGFPPTAGRIVQLANRASIVIYTLDPRGLVSQFFTAVDAKGTMTLGNGIDNDEAKRLAAYRDTQNGLDQIAQGTGGIFFHDYNNLSQGLANALDDMSSYYLIGYQPERTDFDQVRGLPKFHKIEVKVLRAGLQVRSRNGFVGVPDPPVVPADVDQNSAKEELRKALFSPFHANGFLVHLSAFYSAATAKDPKSGRHPALLRAMLAIDAHNLKFKDIRGGGKQLNLEIVAAAYGANNEMVASSDRTFDAAMTPDEMNQTVASGLVYGFEIEIRNPGPYQLRVAAWDANWGRIGSATTFVEIPDFNRPGLALSSVQLYDSDLKRNEELTHAGVLGAGSAITRVFAQGAVLKYDCAVYGWLIDRQAGKPKIDVAVRLFRGAEQILSGEPIPVATSGGNSTAPLHATGEIKLPATLPPGDYALELTVYDRLEKSTARHAEQFVDFTLAK